jgi:hypothetical protein
MSVDSDTRNSISLAAARMRRHRERRRDGLICITIELRATEIADLVRRGYLATDEIEDKDAIREALYKHLDRTLDVR